MILELVLALQSRSLSVPATQSYPAGRSLAHISALVPDEQTAADIGKAVFRPLFGDSALNYSLPFRARLNHGIWRVVGTPPANPNMAWDPIYIYIAKTNGWVLEISRSPRLSKRARDTFLRAMQSPARK